MAYISIINVYEITNLSEPFLNHYRTITNAFLKSERNQNGNKVIYPGTDKLDHSEWKKNGILFKSVKTG